jgi:DNA sulfur modification protein DndD
MRINRIIIKNYRQFRQADISFPKRRDTDLHFIVGANGTGKTNILNAINWCLYGDEPHLSKESQSLPPINLKTIGRFGADIESEVAIEVRAETEDHILINFIRKAKYYKSTSMNIERQGETFEVRHVDEQGNTKIVKDDDADIWVERFVPKGIREFFFFDGERLDHYFKEATGQNIRHAVFQISQIDLLENCIERKLQSILDELRKEAGRANPKIEAARTELERLKALSEDFKRRLADCEEQISIAKSKICEYDEKLKGVPDVIRRARTYS